MQELDALIAKLEELYQKKLDDQKYFKEINQSLQKALELSCKLGDISSKDSSPNSFIENNWGDMSFLGYQKKDELEESWVVPGFKKILDGVGFSGQIIGIVSSGIVAIINSIEGLKELEKNNQ